jgi:hypothetical protein
MTKFVMTGRKKIICTVSLGALLLIGADVLAQPAQPTLQQTLRPPEQPRVGQPIPMTLELEHPAGTQLLPPQAPADPRVALLPPRIQTQVHEGGQRTTVQLDWMVWRPGQTTLPALELTLVDDNGQAIVLRTQPEMLRVTGALDANQEHTLAGPLGPLRIFREDQRSLLVAAGSAAAGLLLLGLIALIARKLKPEVIPAAPKPAHQQALDALHALAAQDLVAQGKTLIYYERLSEIVRDYLGRRYGFPGTELTTSEILTRLEDVRWPAGISAEEIRRWLQHTDMVKFAGERPDAPRAAEALRQAFSLVELTKPTVQIEPQRSVSVPAASQDTPQDAPQESSDGPPALRPSAEEAPVNVPNTVQTPAEQVGAAREPQEAAVKDPLLRALIAAQAAGEEAKGP